MSKGKKTYCEIQKFNQSVIHNFEVSVVMSFYKKLEEFKKVLPKNAPFFQHNGIEVIIVLDGLSEKEGLIDLVKKFPFINWKVIFYNQENKSHNRTRSLNEGIRHSTKKYILISEPGIEFKTDVVFQLRDLLENYPDHYAIGAENFIEKEDEIITPGFQFPDYVNIMVEKAILEKIGGYDKKGIGQGYENLNLVRRLDMGGVKKLFVPCAKSLQKDKTLKLNGQPDNANRFAVKEIGNFIYPAAAKVTTENQREKFDKIVYNWQNNSYAEELCRKYLDGFVQYEIKDSSIFQKKYKKLILCQAYNESGFMTGFLEDMAKYFDGIILLDDGSTDNTWQLAQHEKLLLKVKKTRQGFNDLENRNILLNIASFFQSEWFCFMDIDERFDERFVDFSTFEDNRDINVVAFKGVYLWNSMKTYKCDVPYSKNGLIKIFRMFRPLGRLQINTHKQKLHFAAIPYNNSIFHSKILFKDYGSLTKKKRSIKYEMYKKEDESHDLSSYEYLLSDDNLLEIEKIDLNKENRGQACRLSPVHTHYKTTN